MKRNHGGHGVSRSFCYKYGFSPCNSKAICQYSVVNFFGVIRSFSLSRVLVPCCASRIKPEKAPVGAFYPANCIEPKVRNRLICLNIRLKAERLRKIRRIYAPWDTRRSGRIEHLSYGNAAAALEILNGPDARKQVLRDPEPSGIRRCSDRYGTHFILLCYRGNRLFAAGHGRR
jgi:hypothetical protein